MGVGRAGVRGAGHQLWESEIYVQTTSRTATCQHSYSSCRYIYNYSHTPCLFSFPISIYFLSALTSRNSKRQLSFPSSHLTTVISSTPLSNGGLCVSGAAWVCGGIVGVSMGKGLHCSLITRGHPGLAVGVLGVAVLPVLLLGEQVTATLSTLIS